MASDHVLTHMQVEGALDQTLKRLDVDYLDLYLCATRQAGDDVPT